MPNPITKLKSLYFYLTSKEGGKVQVSRGNVIEIVRILSDLSVEHPEIFDLIKKNGIRRNAKEKIKKIKLKGE